MKLGQGGGAFDEGSSSQIKDSGLQVLRNHREVLVRLCTGGWAPGLG